MDNRLTIVAGILALLIVLSAISPPALAQANSLRLKRNAVVKSDAFRLAKRSDTVCNTTNESCCFKNLLADESKKMNLKVGHQLFCPMLICHGSCATSNKPCTMKMFGGKVVLRKENDAGCGLATMPGR
jgi:hypothetical protein